MGKTKRHCRECNGTGYVKCYKCNGAGVIPCERCNTTGSIVEYFGIREKHTFIDADESFINIFPTNFPIVLKYILNGYTFEDDDVKKISKSWFNNKEKKRLGVGEFYFEDFQNFLRRSRFSHLERELDKLIYEINKGIDPKFKKIIVTKLRVTLLKMKVFLVKYKYNNKIYNMWIYGRHNKVYTENSPFIDYAYFCKQKADTYLDNGKNEKSIKYYEKACKIAQKNNNHILLCDSLSGLNHARKRGNKYYIIGASVSVALVIFTYFLLMFFMRYKYPSVNFLKFPSYVMWPLDVIMNLIIPSFFFGTLFYMVVRDNIKIRGFKLFFSLVVPAIYSGGLLYFFNTKVVNSFAVSIVTLVFLIIALALSIIIPIPFRRLYKKKYEELYSKSTY